MNHYHHHTHYHYRNHYHYRTQWKRTCRRTGLGQSSFVYPCALSPGHCLACPGCFLPRHGPFWPYHGPDPGLGFGMVHFFEIHLSQTHRYVSVGGAEAEQAAAAVVAAALVPAAVAAAVAAVLSVLCYPQLLFVPIVYRLAFTVAYRLPLFTVHRLPFVLGFRLPSLTVYRCFR